MTETRRPSTLRRNFPTLYWFMTAPILWFGRSRRRVWGAVLVLVSMIAGPLLWWALQLIGLPDIGDPFDVVAFRNFTIPDDRNAFVLYRQAAALFKPLDESGASKVKPGDSLARWSKAIPEVRRWAEENREALALYRNGAERPDALDSSIGSYQEDVKTILALQSFERLALLEASRMEERGDTAEAWRWYRAALRTIWQIGRRGTVVRRMWAQRWHNELRQRLTSWAADNRTTPALLRHAVDDVVACEALAPSDSYALKAEYLSMEPILDGAYNPGRHAPPAWLMSLGSRESIRPLVAMLTPELLQSIADAWRFWRREPERSRRVIRLVTANWLAYYDLPPQNRPQSDPDASSVSIYPFGPGAPSKARVLSPEALDRWFATTQEAKEILRIYRWRRLRINERVNHQALVILLGTELYRRDHGTDPTTPEALVGSYLKSLPSDDPDDDRDETIPRSGGKIE